MPSARSSRDPCPLAGLLDAASGAAADAALADVAEAVAGARTLLITAHVNPDGDALGSQVALGLGLRALGKEARCLVGQEPPEKYRSLLPAGVIECLLTPEQAGRVGPADLCVLLDTSEPERAGAFRPVFFAAGQRRVTIDHHPVQTAKGTAPGDRSGRLPFDHTLVVTEAPATGNLVLALLDHLGVPLDPAIAGALWIAIATDTGWFRFANTTPWALRDAARLVAFGLDTEGLHEQIYESYTVPRAKLLGSVLANLRVEMDGGFVWSSVARKELQDGGLGLGDLDGIIDHLKAVRGARVIALIVEVEPGVWKISLRAKGASTVDGIARKFAGGGHAKAAGGRFTGTLDAMLAVLRPAVRETLAPHGV
jgi:phosphoesterase RecJ-like protein